MRPSSPRANTAPLHWHRFDQAMVGPRRDDPGQLEASLGEKRGVLVRRSFPGTVQSDQHHQVDRLDWFERIPRCDQALTKEYPADSLVATRRTLGATLGEREGHEMAASLDSAEVVRVAPALTWTLPAEAAVGETNVGRAPQPRLRA